MQNQRNCYENVWILSGTSDGPVLVNKLLRLNYSVFVSVVTYRASKSYPNNPKLHIITGKLSGKDSVIDFIKRNKIKLVVDATHPFALVISKTLNKACTENNTPILFFERKSFINKSDNCIYIESLKDLEKIDLKNKNILLAIGSRLLNETANLYLKCGANVFTRILPTCDSISTALGSCIKNSNIAILQPSKKKQAILEKKLCEFWKIDYILSRQSGSYSQKNWEWVISKSDMKLFLVKKPSSNINSKYLFNEYDSLINHIQSKF